MLDGPARILYSAAAYRIPQKVWKLHGRRVWAARILYSVFCILPAAYARPHVHVMHIHVSGGRRGVAAKRKSQTCSQAASNLRVFAHQHIGGQEIANGTLD